MESLQEILEWIKSAWQIQLFKLGESNFTIKTIFMLILSLFLLFYISGKIKKLLTLKIFPRYRIDVGKGHSMATIVRYVLIIIGVVIIFQTSGVNLSALGVLVGALGVGIGFGLQSVTNNFISGIIILFERPVKVGDRVEIEGLTGNIVKISARATTILTNENIAVIVPNSDLINKRVINWSHNNRKVRINISVGVSYNENPKIVEKILLKVASENEGVLKDPAPYVRFEEFGESSLNFNLLVWTFDYIDKPNILKSELYFAIFGEFKEMGIEIPFPQRDIHIKSNQGV
jgi:small-conductance mechanosensitive channel